MNKVKRILTEAAPGVDSETILREGLAGKWIELDRPEYSKVLEFETTNEMERDAAWEICRSLKERGYVIEAEPCIVVPGIEPEEKDIGRYESYRSWGGGEHLPDSADSSWALKMINACQAWEYAENHGGPNQSKGKGILIAHPDTGFTYHDQIIGDGLLTERGYDFLDDNEDPLDILDGVNPGHGTATSSVIISKNDYQGDRICGVAPEAKLIPLRVIENVVVFDFAHVARAIEYAEKEGFHVISMSLGGVVRSGILRRRIQSAVSNGILVLAAAGNIYPFVVYPAKFPEVIAVAACNANAKKSGAVNRMWKGTATGHSVDVAAPGESVWRARTIKQDGQETRDVGRSSGTSYAVAITAGVASLWLSFHGRDKLLSMYQGLQLQEVFRFLLKNHGVDRPSNWHTEQWGAGVVNAEKLLQAPLPDPSLFRRLRTQSVVSLAEYFPLYGGQEEVLREVIAGEVQLPLVDDKDFDRFADQLETEIGSNPLLRDKINEKILSPPSKEYAGTIREAATRKGVSLHIGLNSVDPQAYENWSGVLNSCEYDAIAMMELAEKQGFETELLCTANATRERVLASLNDAARELVSGDIFLVSYAGHGGSVPDRNFDEVDLCDETWCLFDGQLLDDELRMVWGKFKEGVRVLVVSDSCHSGTVTRAVAGVEESTDGLFRSVYKDLPIRAMPKERALACYRAKKQLYDEVQVAIPESMPSPLARIRLISGCQDNQKSIDGPFNGVFTAQLLRVWRNGHFDGDYDSFHNEIVDYMPPIQTPNHFVYGGVNGVFDQQSPFKI